MNETTRKTDSGYSIQKFLWHLAGFKPSIIETCKIDRYHASIIGVLLLIVGVYATLAWTFFFQTVAQNPILPVIGGIFMGAFIVSFDRALIASMSSNKANPFSLGFRFLLAMLLGVFLSQPMILKIYQPEIKREAQILADQKVKERKKELTRLYQPEIKRLTDQKSDLESQLEDKRLALASAEADFKKEMDGSGGTGKWGYNTVAKQKEKILKRHQEEYSTLKETVTPKLTKIQQDLDLIESKVGAETETFAANNAQLGILIQAEALESLLSKDPSGSLRMRFYLLSLILTLVELSALIGKLLFRTKSYKSKIQLITEDEVSHADASKEIMLQKIGQYKDLAQRNQYELIQEFFDQSQEVNKEKLGEMIDTWRHSKDSSHKNYWDKFKDIFIIHD